MDRGTSVAHVHKVVAIEDRVLRNYWVTQSYFDLSSDLRRVLDDHTANWCTFATWASHTVGQNMRGEDLPAWLRSRIVLDDGMMGVLHDVNEARAGGVAHLVREIAPDHVVDVVRELFGACALNLSDGNTEVFAEIGPAAATFLECYGPGAGATDDAEARERVSAACEGALLFEGENHLRSGFTRWCDAMSEPDPERKSQLILAGSLHLGAHEQNHLQRAIQGSIDMGMDTSLAELHRRLRFDGEAGAVEDDVIRVLHPAARAIADLWGDLMTTCLGTIETPDGTLHLDRDVPQIAGAPFVPGDLSPVVVDELTALLTRFDRSRGEGLDSAANNWVLLDERMNFITNLFRSRHHRAELFVPPFTADVVARIEAGQIPTAPTPRHDSATSATSRQGRAPSIGIARYTDDFLEALRHEGDVPADSAVSEFFVAAGLEHSDLFRSLVRSKPDPSASAGAGTSVSPSADDGATPGIDSFLAAAESWPDWVDAALVDEGQRVFGDWGPQLGMALWMASLPADYACARGALPLVHTTRLTKQPKRRYVETGQMVIDAMTPGALQPGAAGYSTVRHVRLMHAAVRHVLLHASEIDDAVAAGVQPWDQTLGVPINQEELLGCLLSFSVVGIQSLERSGVRLTAREREAYIHVWNLVGHQIGIRDGLLPLDWNDSCEVWSRLQRLEYAPSDAGRELTIAAIECMQELIGVRALRGLPASGIRHFLGDETADLLGVPPSDWTRTVFRLAEGTNRFYATAAMVVPGRGRFTARIGLQMLRGFELCERNGDRPAFRVTDELKEAWGWDVPSLPRRTLQGVSNASAAVTRRLPKRSTSSARSPGG